MAAMIKPFTPGLFANIMQDYSIAHMMKLEKENEHLRNVIRAYKGNKTKRDKNK